MYVVMIFTVFLLAVVGEAAELRLRPAELELIDGRKLSGQLAAETETHLVLYSRGGGSLHGFPKTLVHAVVAEGERRDVNPKRAMTEAESKLPCRTGWPDAAPETGPKPEYTAQQWPAPQRLLIWANPGKSGRVIDPANWQVFGAPLDPGGKVWDHQTDALLPASDKPYTAVGGVDEPVSGRLNLTFRHMTVENGAAVASQDARLTGNLWLREEGAMRIRFSIIFAGPHHTFIRNDRPRLFKVGVNPHDLPERTRAGYYLSQYITVQKERDASVEFAGHFLSNDKFFVFGGTCILGPGSAVMSSNRNPDRIGPDARIELMSGAIWGKHINQAAGESYDIAGTVTVGSPKRPITEDTYIAMPFKDYTGVCCGRRDVTVARQTGGDWKGDCFGFHVTRKGRFRIYSADPTKARAVFCFHGRETSVTDAGINYSWNELGKNKALYAKLPRRIDLVLEGDVEMNGVLFQDVHKGGIRLADLAMKEKFQNVFWGSNCGGKPEEMFVVFKPSTAPIGWTEAVAPLLQGN